jgi:hypothetical protein
MENKSQAFSYQIPNGKPVLWIMDCLLTKEQVEDYEIIPTGQLIIFPKYSLN